MRCDSEVHVVLKIRSNFDRPLQIVDFSWWHVANLRQTVGFISFLNWPRGGHSLFPPRAIILVVLYGFIVLL